MDLNLNFGQCHHFATRQMLGSCGTPETPLGYVLGLLKSEDGVEINTLEMTRSHFASTLTVNL